MLARIRPSCGIVETVNVLDEQKAAIEKMEKALARLEKTLRQYRRRGEWGKRGDR